MKEALIMEHKRLGCPVNRYRNYNSNEIVVAAQQQLASNNTAQQPLNQALSSGRDVIPLIQVKPIDYVWFMNAGLISNGD